MGFFFRDPESGFFILGLIEKSGIPGIEIGLWKSQKNPERKFSSPWFGIFLVLIFLSPGFGIFFNLGFFFLGLDIPTKSHLWVKTYSRIESLDMKGHEKGHAKIISMIYSGQMMNVFRQFSVLKFWYRYNPWIG